VDEHEEYYGGDRSSLKIVECAGICSCIFLPLTLALILTFVTRSSQAATDIRNMPTIVPPANETFQIAILPDGSVLLPNGT